MYDNHLLPAMEMPVFCSRYTHGLDLRVGGEAASLQDVQFPVELLSIEIWGHLIMLHVISSRGSLFSLLWLSRVPNGIVRCTDTVAQILRGRISLSRNHLVVDKASFGSTCLVQTKCQAQTILDHVLVWMLRSTPKDCREDWSHVGVYKAR